MELRCASKGFKGLVCFKGFSHAPQPERIKDIVDTVDQRLYCLYCSIFSYFEGFRLAVDPQKQCEGVLDLDVSF